VPGGFIAMKKNTLNIISIVLVLCTANCSGLFGPSDQEVMDALNSSWMAFASVPVFQDSMAEELQYNDTVEMYNENEDRSITHNSIFTIDTEENVLAAEGICSFDEFEDDTTEYTINGTIEYSVSGNMNRNSDEMDLEIIFDLTYEGGNIESIEFIVDDENMQSGEAPELIVNGRSFRFKEDLKNEVFRILRDKNVI
jgi:hypothetical protein